MVLRVPVFFAQMFVVWVDEVGIGIYLFLNHGKMIGIVYFHVQRAWAMPQILELVFGPNVFVRCQIKHGRLASYLVVLQSLVDFGFRQGHGFSLCMDMFDCIELIPCAKVEAVKLLLLLLLLLLPLFTIAWKSYESCENRGEVGTV